MRARARGPPAVNAWVGMSSRCGPTAYWSAVALLLVAYVLRIVRTERTDEKADARANDALLYATQSATVFAALTVILVAYLWQLVAERQKATPSYRAALLGPAVCR